jgi:hypothetical protein
MFCMYFCVDKLKIPLSTFSLSSLFLSLLCIQGAMAASVQSALEANTNQHQAHRRAWTAPLAPTRQWHPQPRVLVCALRVPPTPSLLLVCMHICLICMLTDTPCVCRVSPCVCRVYHTNTHARTHARTHATHTHTHTHGGLVTNMHTHQIIYKC